MAIHAATAAGAAPRDDGLDRCIGALRDDLVVHPEVELRTFDALTARAADLRPLIEDATRTQPEFRLKVWDYLARLADAERVAQGRALLAREAAALDPAAERIGVDLATAVAVFGVETDYGRVAGRYPVVDATLSRACLDLTSVERKRHFFAALWLLQHGIVREDDFRGSWAGAFGMTQFMPGTFVDVLRDTPDLAPPDIVHSVPDALATTARYLKSLGWVDGLPWGVEVRVPEPLARWNALEGDHGCLATSPGEGRCRSVAEWRADGVVAIDGASIDGASIGVASIDGASSGRASIDGTSSGRATTDADSGGPASNDVDSGDQASIGSGSGGAMRALSDALPSSARAALLMPAGPDGPAWLVTSNYQAIWRYNRSDAYALAIGLLSNALKGRAPQQAAWPTDDPGLSRREFREVQALLQRAGHADVTVDGADGPRTRAAVEDEERRLGWAATGRAGLKLLEALRRSAARDADGSGLSERR